MTRRNKTKRILGVAERIDNRQKCPVDCRGNGVVKNVLLGGNADIPEDRRTVFSVHAHPHQLPGIVRIGVIVMTLFREDDHQIARLDGNRLGAAIFDKALAVDDKYQLIGIHDPGTDVVIGLAVAVSRPCNIQIRIQMVFRWRMEILSNRWCHYIARSLSLLVAVDWPEAEPPSTYAPCVNDYNARQHKITSFF